MVNKALLFEGLFLIVIGEFVILLLPDVDINNASLAESYYQAMSSMLWNVIVLIGWAMCLIWIVIFGVRSKLSRFECGVCGTKITNDQDVFCRQCGAKLILDADS